MGSKSKMPGQRRTPWHLSQTRHAKKVKAYISLMRLVYGEDVVSRAMLDEMYTGMERQGVLDEQSQSSQE